MRPHPFPHHCTSGADTSSACPSLSPQSPSLHLQRLWRSGEQRHELSDSEGAPDQAADRLDDQADPGLRDRLVAMAPADPRGGLRTDTCGGARVAAADRFNERYLPPRSAKAMWAASGSWRLPNGRHDPWSRVSTSLQRIAEPGPSSAGLERVDAARLLRWSGACSARWPKRSSARGVGGRPTPTFHPGRGRVPRGDPGDTLHLIAKGHVAVRIATPLGDTALLRVLGEGQYFGELAVVAPAPRRPRSSASTWSRHSHSTVTCSRSSASSIRRWRVS